MRRRRFSQTPPAKFHRQNFQKNVRSANRSPAPQTRSAGSALVRGISLMTPRSPGSIVDVAARSSSLRKQKQNVRRTLQFEEGTTPDDKKPGHGSKEKTPNWLGFADRFKRYVFQKRGANKGIPVPCTEGQWHAARMYDDVRNGHSYVMHQWIDYLKEKRVLTNEVAFEGNLKFDPIPIRIASLLATGLDSVRVIEDITKDSKRNTNILSGALCNIASESSRLTARLNRGRRESKTSSSRRGRRNAIVSVPVGIISPHSRRKNRNRHNMITEQAVSHCSHVYSHQQSCPCVLSLKNGIITSTPRNQPEEVRSPFSFRSRIKPITISIDSNVCVRKITNTLCFSILIGNDLQKEEMRFRCKTLEDRVRWVRSIRIASRRFADLRTIREETEYLLTELQRDVEDFDTITRDISRKYREQERIVEHALSVFNQLRLCDVPGVRWDMPSCVDG